VQESQAGGFLGAEAGQVIRELFQFGQLTAHEVMVPRVRIRGIPLGAGSGRLRDVLRAGFTRYPVYEGDLDHIVGMVHIKDVLKLLLRASPLAPGNVRPVPWVPETSGLDTLLAVMRRENTQLVMVMDEFGGTAGLVTIEDLFAEVVGDVDAGGGAPPEIYRDRGGRLHVQGTVRLDELGETLGVELEHPEVDTVSGLVLALLERPAEVGDIVTYGPVRFRITAVDGRGVRECAVLNLPEPTEKG
jgi:CBS domain containing-hemolysin-like protein